MSDDLSQFFAKKAAKSKDKKKKVVNVDELGEVLERRVKRQEERDREEENDEKRVQDDSAFFEKRAEDSEWLEYKDTNKEIRLEGLAIRDMNLTEQSEENLEDQKTAPVDNAKTWNAVEPKEERAEDVAEIPPQMLAAKPQIWRPPALRAGGPTRGGTSTTVPDIKNETMFPSFAEADEMEKSKKDDEKKRPANRNDGFTTVTSERDTSNPWGRTGAREPSHPCARSGGMTSVSDRAALISAVKQVTTSGAPNPVPPAQSVHIKNPNAYVPPGRRRAEAHRDL